MANWRERGYVPDSDDDEEEDGRNGSLDSGLARGTISETASNNAQSVKGCGTPLDGDDSRTKQSDTVVDKHDAYHDPAPNGTANLLQDGPQVCHPELSQASDSPLNSTAARLEAEIKKGLQTVQDVLGSAVLGFDTDDDSPLSSVPSSVHTSPKRTQSRPSQPAALPEVEISHIAADDILLLDAAADALRRRSFRPRAPIQLHPYAIEDARYRQTWRDRGLNPLRVPDLPPHLGESSKDDSQGTTAYHSSQVDHSDSQIPQSSPALDEGYENPVVVGDEESQSPIRGTRPRVPAPVSDSDEDLPDLSDLFKNRTATLSISRLKRPKCVSVPQVQTGIDGFRIYELPDEGIAPRKASKTGGSKSIIPPSPPRSGDGLSSQFGEADNTPEVSLGSSTPIVLPTPLVSSDKQVSKRNFTEALDLSDSETDVVSISDDTSVTSGSEERTNDGLQFRQIRRKIKGVLPASWLKLDMKQQWKGTRAARNQAQSPVKRASEKGVAQHISSTGGRARQRTVRDGVADLEVSSESDSAMQVDDDMGGIEYQGPESFEDDVVEDDAIDAMLAPQQRRPYTVNGQRRLQGVRSKKNTFDADRVLSRREPSLRSPRTAAASLSSNRARPRKKTKRKHRKPQMTILDAPGLRDEDVPRFLKIASRRAKRQRSARKQDPSKKFFRLATMRDTEDVNEAVRTWRREQGQIHHSVKPKDIISRTTSSKPQPRGFDDIIHGNTAAPTRISHEDIHFSATHLTFLKRSTNATLDRIQNHQSRSFQAESIGLPTDRSSVILEYFKPGASRRNHLNSRQQVPSVEHSTEEPAFASTNPFAIQKRLPKEARPRQKRVRQDALQKTSTRPSVQEPDPMSPSAEKRGFSPPSPPLLPLRPLKKQRPVSRGTRYANNPDQHDVLCLQSLKLEDDHDIVTSAIRYPPRSSTFSKTPMLSSSTSVRIHLVKTTISSMADTAHRFQPGRSHNAISTPISQRSLNATGWSAEVEGIIRDTFQEIFTVMCGDTAMPDTTPERRTQLLGQAADSIQMIISYANESLFFVDNQGLEAFIRLTTESIDSLWQGVAICESATSETWASQTLKLLNGLLILGYQINRCATAAGCPERLRATSLKIWQNVAGLAWELTFRKHNIPRLFANTAALFGASLVSEGQAIPTTEIETIYLIHQLGPDQEWSVYLETIFSSHGKPGVLFDSSAESLACMVIVLGCLLSTGALDEPMTHVDNNVGSALGSSLLRLLPIQVSDFLKSFVEKKASYHARFQVKTIQVRKLEQFGLVMFQWCFALARNLPTDMADNLLKQMFKYYSEKTNNMLELFTSKHANRTPPFLDRLVRAEQLNLEDTDTDFDIFLKLTAITLIAQPRPDTEVEEHIRKLALRKRSLLFILLPNKGQDTFNDNEVIVSEDCPLPDRDLTSVSNRYTLFTTLYHYAPVGFKPEISQIRDYVDFATAHDAVRQVILRCWENVAKSALTQPAGPAELLELGGWMLAMFFAMCDKLTRIPNVDDDMHEDERRIHLANRNTTVDRVLHIADRYVAAIDICTTRDQVSHLLSHEEVSRLTVSCYHDQGLGDVVVSGIFNLVTSYVMKGIGNVTDEIFAVRREIRGVLVDQLNRTDSPDDILLASLTETWFAIGKLMVEGGHSQWDHFLNAWSSMSFPQIADTEIARQCQVLLLSKIATDRSVVLADPYPFIHTWLWSILKPETMIRFEHCLTNQLMESIPDTFGLDDLRQDISNGATRYFLDKSDIIKHRLLIVHHIIRYAYSVQNLADPTSHGKLTKYQWDHLMTMISRAMKQTWEQLDGRARPEWTTFMQKVIFRLGMYKGPGFEIDPWFTDLSQKGFEDKAFHLERLFICLPGEKRPDRYDTEYMIKAFRTACEMAWINNKEKPLLHHLITIFAATDPSYVEHDGSFLLDITKQLDFMKAVFPAYIERSLNDTLPTMLFAVPILDVAIQILLKLEMRVDLQDQSHMESFAELLVTLMGAAVAAMQHQGCEALYDLGWEIDTVCRLGGICWLGCSRWAHLHRLFPFSDTILALQPYVQTYAYYAYEWICSAAGLEDGARPTDPALWARYRKSADRAKEDFGFELPELALPEHINALKEFAANDLEWSGRNEWHRGQFSTWGPVWGPVWVLARPGSEPETRGPREAVQDGSMVNEVRAVLVGMEQGLTLLGLMEEWL
ncbi:hypothetical protein AYO20_05257 [Fonsecaea nubica]|uniref:Uncharacterized protein n=1 Tax=Fonsecaea nubica TaxID=856822 RepID=A0A178D174_9EURO|nr:hypothetical protein AYO20_05257 [Fonsecaea nubica]OAL35407.1 hypothetical protein AYO20_05257 [Fonsecaea nubica]